MLGLLSRYIQDSSTMQLWIYDIHTGIHLNVIDMYMYMHVCTNYISKMPYVCVLQWLITIVFGLITGAFYFQVHDNCAEGIQDR